MRNCADGSPQAGYMEVQDDSAYGDLAGLGLPVGMDEAVMAMPGRHRLPC